MFGRVVLYRTTNWPPCDVKAFTGGKNVAILGFLAALAQTTSITTVVHQMQSIVAQAMLILISGTEHEADRIVPVNCVLLPISSNFVLSDFPAWMEWLRQIFSLYLSLSVCQTFQAHFLVATS